MVPLPTLLDLPAPIDGARTPWYPTPGRSLSRFALFPPNTSRPRRPRRAPARTRVRHHAPPPPAAPRWSPRANNRPSPTRVATTSRDERQASAERDQPTRAGIKVARTPPRSREPAPKLRGDPRRKNGLSSASADTWPVRTPTSPDHALDALGPPPLTTRWAIPTRHRQTTTRWFAER